MRAESSITGPPGAGAPLSAPSYRLFFNDSSHESLPRLSRPHDAAAFLERIRRGARGDRARRDARARRQGGARRAGSGESAGGAAAAFCAEGEARDLPPPHGFAAQSRSLRLQAGAGKARRSGLPRRVHQGPEVRLHGGQAEADGQPAHVLPGRAQRALALRRDPAPAYGGGRSVHHPLDAHRTVQPRAGGAVALHRFAAARPAVDGLVGDLRARLGEPKSPRLRGAHLERLAAQRREEFLWQRVSALGLPGRAMPLEGRPGALRLGPGGLHARPAPRQPRCVAGAQRTPGGRARPPGDAHAHRAMRNTNSPTACSSRCPR